MAARSRFLLCGIHGSCMQLLSNGRTGRSLVRDMESTGRMLTRISAPRVSCGAHQRREWSPASSKLPPNPRLQRTGLRSPLSSRPSGPAKVVKSLRVGVPLVVAFLLGQPLMGAGIGDSKATPVKVRQGRYVPKRGDFTVVCTLFNSDPPGRVSLSDIPITYDPMFVVGARVEHVMLGTSPWKVGESVRFLIHSPTLMLGGYQFDGQRFSMTFSPFRPKTKDDKIWFKPETRYLLRWIEKIDETQPKGGA